MTLRSAVIGTGRIASEHLEFLSGHPDVELAGVCDLSRAMASFTAHRYGAVMSTSSTEDLLRTRPDVVHICTPAGSHEDLIRAALLADAHVVCEKPIALSSDRFRALAELADTRGLTLTEDHNYRFNRPVLRLEEFLRGGLLGELRDVAVTMALPLADGRYASRALRSASHDLPAGVLHEFISHLCYLGLLFAGPHTAVQSATWARVNGCESYNDLAATVNCAEAVLRLRFMDAWPGRLEITVTGTTGQASCDLIRPHVRFDQLRRSGQQLSPIESLAHSGLAMLGAAAGTFRDKLLQRTAYEGLATFLRRTYDSLRSGTATPVTIPDQLRTLDLIDDLLHGGKA
jgi:predicted dehydrogenase